MTPEEVDQRWPGEQIRALDLPRGEIGENFAALSTAHPGHGRGASTAGMAARRWPSSATAAMSEASADGELLRRQAIAPIHGTRGISQHRGHRRAGQQRRLAGQSDRQRESSCLSVAHGARIALLLGASRQWRLYVHSCRSAPGSANRRRWRFKTRRFTEPALSKMHWGQHTPELYYGFCRPAQVGLIGVIRAIREPFSGQSSVDQDAEQR